MNSTNSNGVRHGRQGGIFGIGLCAYVVLCIYLGSIIVAYAPPLYSLSARFLISGLIGVIIALILGQSWRLSRKQWISVAVFGVCQNALYLGLNFVAMQTVEASLAAIIASTMPLIVACAGWIIFRNVYQHLEFAG